MHGITRFRPQLASMICDLKDLTLLILYLEGAPVARNLSKWRQVPKSGRQKYWINAGQGSIRNGCILIRMELLRV